MRGEYRIPTKAELVSILKRSRARITDPVHWSRGITVADADMRPVLYGSPKASRWCAIGSVQQESMPVSVLDEANGRLQYSTIIIRNLFFERLGIDIVATNDDLGHGATLAAFDELIAILEQELETAKPLTVGVDVPAFTALEQKETVPV